MISYPYLSWKFFLQTCHRCHYLTVDSAYSQFLNIFLVQGATQYTPYYQDILLLTHHPNVRCVTAISLQVLDLFL